MGKGRQELTALEAQAPKGLMQPPNPIAQIQTKFKELESGFKCWASKQPFPVEASVATVGGATQGALMGGLMGGLMGMLNQDMSSSAFMPMPPTSSAIDPKTTATLHGAQALSGGPLIQARNFAVMTGVNAGLSCILKKVRGKEDVQSSMIAAFGSGAMFSLVSGFGGPNQIPNIISSGAFFALAQGGIFKLGEMLSSKQQVEDPFYVKTRSMLTDLGLQNYENNFKRGMLNDRTLPLLTDSALSDVRIPPGPRIVILDYIERDPELKERPRK